MKKIIKKNYFLEYLLVNAVMQQSYTTLQNTYTMGKRTFLNILQIVLSSRYTSSSAHFFLW